MPAVGQSEAGRAPRETPTRSKDPMTVDTVPVSRATFRMALVYTLLEKSFT